MGKNFFHWRFLAKTTRAGKTVSPSVEQLAQEGNAEAQFQLGLKCSGAGVSAQDELQAAEWYLKAAEQNHGLAQFNLGQMFASGKGVTQDAAKSLFWFRRSAHSGIAGAQFCLGRVWHRSSLDGSATDAHEARIEAYVWYALAAAQNYDAAQSACAQLTVKMTWDEVSEARRRVVDSGRKHLTTSG